jgi:hypothetical protein
MFQPPVFAMLKSMQRQRVVRRLVRSDDGWQVVWTTAPQEPPTGPAADARYEKEVAMNKRSILRGCLLAGLPVLLVLAAGLWWISRSRFPAAETPPQSPVLVFLISPTSGDEFTVGDYLPVTVRTIAPEDIVSAELFVDGQSLGVVYASPEDAWWTWQAWPAGIHTLMARATAADGQVGESQTVIVNVLAGGGLIRISAEEGQTLEQIGANYGVHPDQMAAANPHVDPSEPLPGGFSVRVPDGGSEGRTGEGGGEQVQGEKLSPIPHITWQFTPIGAVDRSYCYVSIGGGQWEKIPKKPFQFFNGPQTYIQFDLPAGGGASLPAVQAQCWGWLGDALKYLGEGETQFEAALPPNPLVVTGQGFELVGMPDMSTMAEGGLPPDVVPPPHSLRPPINAEECASHYPNPLAKLFVAWLCDELLNGGQDPVLQWEWQSGCWPGQEGCIKIDGYLLYILYKNDPEPSIHYLREINNPEQKVAGFPLPWGHTCYGVAAYIEDTQSGGKNISDMATYCPASDAPIRTTVRLTPAKTATVWKGIAGRNDALYCMDLNHYSDGEHLLPGSAKVGYSRSYDPGTEPFPCWSWGSYVDRGLVQFDLSPLAGKSRQIARARLEYDATWEVRFGDETVAQSWGDSFGGSIHLVNVPWGPFYIASGPIINLPGGPVRPGYTSHFSLPISYIMVRDWVEGVRPNYGLLFVGWDESFPSKSKDIQRAILSNLVLEVELVESK